MTLDRERFGDFFSESHDGAPPFLWQWRLLDAVIDTGHWPDRIIAPTGAGKTSVIDVHAFAVALMAVDKAPRVPRRLSLVVDRRALVDSQFDLARQLNKRLAGALPGSLLAAVRDALLSLRGDCAPGSDPLHVVMLRGGVEPSRRWVDDPTAAAIICATPAMWGSRLLFRGYGTPRHARPREAGLLAYDSVVIVDEAHLARQLVATARRIDVLEAMASEPMAPPRVQVVEASATVGQVGAAERAVGVLAADLDESAPGGEILARRLRAPKPLRLIEAAPPPTGVTRAATARALADHAEALHDRYGPTVACVANTVATALSAAAELGKRGRRVELLVGRLRPHDVTQLRKRHPGLLTLAGDTDVEIVVATQTIEVGLDADFSALVSELAPGSAIAQRAGRVNRMGDRASTEVRVLVPDGPVPVKSTHPYDPADLEHARAWLLQRAVDEAGLAPYAVSQDPPPPASLRRVVLGRPEAWHALYLAQTSDDPFAEPDLELLLADELEPELDLSLVIRRLPFDDPVVQLAFLRATPPRQSECFPVTLKTLHALLARDPRPVYRWRADELSLLDQAAAIRPGDIVVVSDDAPWFVSGVADRDGHETASDVLEDDLDGEPFVLRIAPGMPIDVETGGSGAELLLDDLGGIVEEYPEDGRARRAAMADGLADAARRLGIAPESVPGRRIATAIALLQRRLADTGIEIAWPTGTRHPSWIVILDQRRRLADEDVRQTWSSAQEPVDLVAHQAAVAQRAAGIGARLGLGDQLIDALRLAGELHDEGKRDRRFQRLLGNWSDDGLALPAIAKSAARTPGEYRAAKTASGLPSEWRHEQLSAVIAWDQTGQGADGRSLLVTRLVGTSHGRGRATFPHATRDLVVGDDQASTASGQLHDQGIWDALVERTHESHGIWGCAFLESIVRAADGQVSGEGG